MSDSDRSRDELLREIGELHRRIRELEESESERERQFGRSLPPGRPYRLLRDAEADFVFTQNLDASLTAISTLAEPFLDYPSDDWRRLWTGFAAVTPRSVEACQKAFDEMHALAMEGRPVPHAWRVEVEFVRRDGTVVPTETTFTFVHAIDGKPTGIVGVARDMSRDTRTETALRYLSRRLLDLQETERRRTSRELHDEVGQALTGVKLMLGQALAAPSEQSAQIITETQALIDELMVRVSEMSRELRPSVLDDLGIVPALQWFFARYERQTRVKVRFHQDGPECRLAPVMETAIYRIVQEALTNAARHSGVKSVEVALSLGQDGVTIQVADKGVGFDPAAKLESGQLSGIVGMRERALSLGGDLRVQSRVGAGTCIFVDLPLAR